VPAITGRLQARHPGQTIVAAKAKAAKATAATTETATRNFCQKTIIHGKSVQAQVSSGLFHVLVASRQWAGLSGRER